MDKVIADNVSEFISRTSKLVGISEARRFDQEMYRNCLDLKITSPIEQLFFVAVHALCKSAFVAVNPDVSHEQYGEKNPYKESRIFITQQAIIGKYRVDFLMSCDGIGPSEMLTPIVVELDGHDFHDKDKRQRSYEKERDRFLVKQGLRVLHFTGADVVADPFKVAYESLDMLCAFEGIRDLYNAEDPMGLESL